MADDILDQAKADVRREQWAMLWKRYGSFVIGLVIVTLLAVFGISQWQAHKVSQRYQANVLFEQAIEQIRNKRPASAQRHLEDVASLVAGEEKNGYALLASYKKALVALEEDAPAKAFDLYQEIAATPTYPVTFQEMAQVAAGYLALDHDLWNETVEGQLKTLIEQESPWQGSAYEILAYAAYDIKDYAQATALINEATAVPNLPAGIGQRLGRLQTLLSETAPVLETEEADDAAE